MKKYYWNNTLKISFAFIVVLALSSCSTPYKVEADGYNVNNETVDIKTLGVYLQVSTFSSANKSDKMAASLANWNNNYVFPIMAQRIKDVFQANNIFVKSTLTSFDVPVSSSSIQTSFPDFEYVLHIQPNSLVTGNRTGTHYSMSARLFKMHKGLVWSGSVTINEGWLNANKFSDATDQILSQLLARLKTDGVISIEKITVPVIDKNNLPPLRNFGMIPGLDNNGRHSYSAFLNAPLPRAFALSPEGSAVWASGPKPANSNLPDDVSQRALLKCNEVTRKNSIAMDPTKCKIYAVDNQVIWNGIFVEN